MNAALERIEPVLCCALSAAKQNDWQRTHDALRACANFAELHRAPVYAEYAPAAAMRRAVASLPRPVELDAARAGAHVGDGEQISTLVRALLHNAVLEHDAALRAEFAQLDGVTALRLAIDGPGRFPESLNLGYELSLPYSDCELIWISATRGGRIDARPGQLDLRLKGVRAILDVPTGCEPVMVSLRDAEHRARLLASGEAGANAAGEADFARDGLQRILDEFDKQDDPLKPCDLGVLARERLSACVGEEDVVSFDDRIAAGLPPLTVRRNRMARLFHSLHALARAALTHGGTVRCEIDYASAQRAVNVLFAGQGKTDRGTAAIYVPAIERAVEIHGGEAEADFGSDGFTLLLSIPDPVARALDDWLPGWDTFAPRSIQMLRLSKSGGLVPPEELILHGVLQDELERRLLPRLAVAPAATLVHDLTPRTPNLSALSPQRMEKVLSQLKRGKPKKEICAPAYAAEIVWMFSIDARHAAAIGLKAARSLETEELCRTLASSPVAYISALRLLCRVMHPAPD